MSLGRAQTSKFFDDSHLYKHKSHWTTETSRKVFKSKDSFHRWTLCSKLGFGQVPLGPAHDSGVGKVLLVCKTYNCATKVQKCTELQRMSLDRCLNCVVDWKPQGKKGHYLISSTLSGQGFLSWTVCQRLGGWEPKEIFKGGLEKVGHMVRHGHSGWLRIPNKSSHSGTCWPAWLMPWTALVKSPSTVTPWATADFSWKKQNINRFEHILGLEHHFNHPSICFRG